MSTEIAPTAAESTRRPGSRPAGDTVCWFDGQWTPLADAKVGIMTHSFLYGTAVFEGIRAYWNEEQGQLYLLKLRDALPAHRRLVEDPADGPGLHASTR